MLYQNSFFVSFQKKKKKTLKPFQQRTQTQFCTFTWHGHKSHSTSGHHGSIYMELWLWQAPELVIWTAYRKNVQQKKEKKTFCKPAALSISFNLCLQISQIQPEDLTHEVQPAWPSGCVSRSVYSSLPPFLFHFHRHVVHWLPITKSLHLNSEYYYVFQISFNPIIQDWNSLQGCV